MDALLDELPDVPVLVTIGPADLYAPGVGDAFQEWSSDNDDLVSVIDLREQASPSPSAEEWAQAFADALEGNEE